VRHRQRAAISQAEIRKKCKLYGVFLEGFRAFGRGCSETENPYTDLKKHKAWKDGRHMASLKAEEER